MSEALGLFSFLRAVAFLAAFLAFLAFFAASWSYLTFQNLSSACKIQQEFLSKYEIVKVESKMLKLMVYRWSWVSLAERA